MSKTAEGMTLQEAKVANERLKGYSEKWYKIIDAICEPKKHPLCRDCADGNGTCDNNDNLPCEITDRVIEIYRRISVRVKELEQSNKELVEASDRMGEAMDKLLKGLATDGVAIEGFTDAWTARHRYVELKLKIELSRFKEVVPDNKTV